MVSYIPVLTTLLSVFFLSRIVPHYLAKRSPYLLWWTLGVLTFGLGTLTESINAIFGWSEWNTKSLVHRRRPAGRISPGPGDDLPAHEQALRRHLGRGVLGGHRHCRRVRVVLAD